ncbi:hypothetical protein [Peribacillus simplex]|uniref:Uncharacterized protein n=1 Tax=Peribacillus simplex TaxID=1478 RepID=A0A9W4KMY3_9BACI|nr:hypothetical protein [Peribacillus simplex]MDR4925103.1 hypothetical protein [Peribacillus simplex]CAH0151580.1 hypothetical protein SRABI133_00724 [Peribacillus simplex]
MKKKFGILGSIIIVLTGYFLFTKPYKDKTKPVEDIFKVDQPDRVIINEMITVEGIDDVNPGDIDLNDEEEIIKLAKKQYEQSEKGEIIFTEENQ